MDCIRIHTFVHMYVCLYVRANRRIQFANLCDKFAGSRVHLLSFSLSLWSLVGERKGDTAISPVIDWSSWRESRLRNSYRTSQLAFILVSFLVLFRKYFFLFFLSYSSRMNQQLWFCSHCCCCCRCRCSAAALVSCCCCVHWRELRVHNSYFTFDSPLFFSFCTTF